MSPSRLSLPFDCTTVAGSGMVRPHLLVNQTSLVAVFTPTHRHKSVNNRCEIERVGGVCAVALPFMGF